MNNEHDDGVHIVNDVCTAIIINS